MQTDVTLHKYQDQVKSLAAYARAVKFDFKTGDFDKLLKDWLKRGRKLHTAITQDQDRAIRIVKSYMRP